MPDDEYVKPKRWEGKPFPFKLRYMLANYPEIAITGLAFLVFIPIVGGYRLYNFAGSRHDSLKKFKGSYTVIRDDDPKVEFYKQQKEIGRHHFPEY